MIHDILIERTEPHRTIYKRSVNVDSSEDLDELIGFIKAGIEAYEDWKVNGD